MKIDCGQHDRMSPKTSNMIIVIFGIIFLVVTATVVVLW